MASPEIVRIPSPLEAGTHRTLAVVFAGFCSFVGLYATQPLLPLLERVFNTGKVGASLTVTAATLGVALAAPLIGSIADRFGRKRVIVWSSALLAVSTLFSATAASLPMLVLWRFLQGIFTPGVFAVTVAYIQEEWAGAGAGSATAAYVTGGVVGGFTGRVTSGLIASHANWHWSFVVLGSLGLVGTLLLRAWLPRERNFTRKPDGASMLRAAGHHLRNKRLLATYAAGFCVLFSMLGVFSYVTFYLAAPPFHLSPGALGSLFFVFLIGAVLTPPCGRLIDRYGPRLTLTAAMAFAIVGVSLTLAHSLWVVVAGLAVCCSGVFVAQSSTNSHIGIAAEHNKALAVGLYVTFYYAGGSVGGVLPGYLWPLGGWPACVALFALVQLATLTVALAWWRPPTPAGGGGDLLEPLTSL